MLVMDTINSKPNINGTSNANDDSEEEEEISSEYQQESPRINVTDNEVGESEMADSAMIMALASSPTAATDCPRLQLQHPSPQSPKSSDISLLSLNIFSPLIGTSLVDDVANTQPTPHDLKQLERDKNTVYSHPLFPLLALLFEKCEIATSSISSFDTDASLTSFNTEIEEFIQHQQSSEKSFFTNNPEVDSLMIRAIQVFRIHLLELEKVSDLCKDFCQRYISCLRTKMRSDVLLRGTGNNNTDDLMKSDDLLDNFSETNQQPHETSSTFLSSSASSMSSSSGSGSALCPSPQDIIHCPSPPSPSLSTSSLRSSNPHSSHTPDLDLSKSPMSPYLGINFDQIINPYYKFSIPKYNLLNVNFTEDNSRTNEVQSEDNMVVHDLSLKKKVINNSPSHNNDNVSTANRCKNTLTSMALVAVNNVDNTSDIATPKPAKTSQTKSKKSYLEKVSTGSHSKRGVLPKQATSIMRSWLFQHIVHPYPTEDEKRAIASETNLTLLQVNNWFINARRRILQPMLDSANSVHSELVPNSGETPTDLDLFSKTTKIGPNSVHSKKLKTNSSNQLNRFWPQSLANIIQTSDLNSKT